VVAEERSFTRAAERLHTVQPSLSQQIKRFEDEIGTPLFRRDKHGLELTQAGRALLAEAKPLLDGVERALCAARQAGRIESGRLIIGCITGAEGCILSHILPVLREKYPGFDITLKGLLTPEQLQALRDKTIDVGFLRGPVEDPHLCSEPVSCHDIVVALPAEHPLTALDKIPPKALASIPLVQVVEASAPAIQQIVHQISAQCGVNFLSGPMTQGVLETLEVIGSGGGFSLLPSYVRRIKPASVEIRPLDIEPQPTIDLLVAFRGHDQNPILGPFLSMLRQKTLPRLV
jgi:LysR family hca operon transcriptional activator